MEYRQKNFNIIIKQLENTLELINNEFEKLGGYNIDGEYETTQLYDLYIILDKELSELIKKNKDNITYIY